MKKTILLLTALASLTMAVSAHAEPVYGPAVATWSKDHTKIVKARHLTEAARQWKNEAKARGYSDIEITQKLMQAFYEDHNQLPQLPKALINENQRIITHNTMAAVDINSLGSAAYALASEGVGQIDHGEMIIKALKIAGLAIDLNPGDIVTVRDGDRISIPGFDNGVVGINIEYRGMDYIMILMEDAF